MILLESAETEGRRGREEGLLKVEGQSFRRKSKKKDCFQRRPDFFPRFSSACQCSKINLLMKCAQCESESFEELHGHYVCTVCGLQSAEAIVTVFEDLLEEAFDGDGPGGGGGRFIRAIKSGPLRSRSWVSWEEAIQTILRAQCDILVADFGFPVQFTQLVGKLWFHYLASPVRLHRSLRGGQNKKALERKDEVKRARRQYLKENNLFLVKDVSPVPRARNAKRERAAVLHPIITISSDSDSDSTSSSSSGNSSSSSSSSSSSASAISSSSSSSSSSSNYVADENEIPSSPSITDDEEISKSSSDGSTSTSMSGAISSSLSESSSDIDSNSSSDVEGMMPPNSKRRAITEKELPEFELLKERGTHFTDIMRESMTLHLTLELLMVAMLHLRVPVLPRDLCNWAATGRIPYLTAYQLLPQTMYYYRFLKPTSIPSPSVLLKKALELNTKLKLETSIPPLNTLPLLTRMATLMEVPPEIERAAIRLMRLTPKWIPKFGGYDYPYECLMSFLIMAIKLVYRFDDTYALSPIAMQYPNIASKCLPEWLSEQFRLDKARPITTPWLRSELNHFPTSSLEEYVDFLKKQNADQLKNFTDIAELQTMFDKRSTSSSSSSVAAVKIHGRDSDSDEKKDTNNIEDASTRPFCPIDYGRPPIVVPPKKKRRNFRAIYSKDLKGGRKRVLRARREALKGEQQQDDDEYDDDDDDGEVVAEEFIPEIAAREEEENGPKEAKRIPQPPIPYIIFEDTALTPTSHSHDYLLHKAAQILGTNRTVMLTALYKIEYRVLGTSRHIDRKAGENPNLVMHY
jgi:hypothetical protein